MNVWGSVKKFSLVGAMIVVGSMSFTGCLTDDKKDEPAPVDKSIKLTGEKTSDTLWNIAGPYKGAFDLVNNINVGSAGAEADKNLKDLTNPTVLDANGKIVSPKTIGSGNGTMFVVAAGFDYANATDSSVIKAYKAGTGLAATPVLAKDAVVIANLKGASMKYAVIKIQDVVVTADDNKDYFLFSYKLTP
jgi:hypothetical protein